MPTTFYCCNSSRIYKAALNSIKNQHPIIHKKERLILYKLSRHETNQILDKSESAHIKYRCFVKSLIFLFSFAFQLLDQLIHIHCNLLVGDLGIDLRAGNGGVSHHLGNALHRNTSLQSQRTEAMAGKVLS